MDKEVVVTEINNQLSRFCHLGAGVIVTAPNRCLVRRRATPPEVGGVARASANLVRAREVTQ